MPFWGVAGLAIQAEQLSTMCFDWVGSGLHVLNVNVVGVNWVGSGLHVLGWLGFKVYNAYLGLRCSISADHLDCLDQQYSP